MEGWFPVAWSHEIERKPRACRLSGRPLVIYRTEEGSVVAFDDRCPHRHAPLSQGKLVEGTLQCPYHGWSFDQAGQCVRIPASLAQESIERAPPLTSWRVYEGMGLVWVAPQSGKLFTPWDELPEMQASMRDSQTTIEFEKLFEGHVVDVAENILDVPHTAFLHASLFRTDESRNRVEAELVRYGGIAEVHYHGEPRPSGWLGKLLAPEGGEVEHVDRYIWPAIAQVHYRLGDHWIDVWNFLQPIDDATTHMRTVLCGSIPRWSKPLLPVIKKVALSVVDQDAEMLKAQQMRAQEFNHPAGASTELDSLGQEIRRLWKFGPKDSDEKFRKLYALMA